MPLEGGCDWSDRFDGSLADVFALQDKVTQSVVRALEVKLLPGEQIGQAEKETAVPAAYEALCAAWTTTGVPPRRTTPRPCLTSRRRFNWTRATRAPTPRWRWSMRVVPRAVTSMR